MLQIYLRVFGKMSTLPKIVAGILKSQHYPKLWLKFKNRFRTINLIGFK